jgi:hypothetical protein
LLPLSETARFQLLQQVAVSFCFQHRRALRASFRIDIRYLHRELLLAPLEEKQ